MELKNTLSFQTYNNYADRLHKLGETILDAGYELKDNNEWAIVLDQMLVREISKKYFPHLIKDKIFNNQEAILEIVDKAVDWVNPYSQNGFRFSKKNGALYPFVKRWFNWLEYNEKIVNGNFPKQQYLFSIENDVEEQVFDINGEPIMTIEGYFEQTITI